MDRFKRLPLIAPLSPLNYESNQAELNTDSAGITACHIRHPSVKITTSLPLCREPCHAMLTCCNAQDVCSEEEKKRETIIGIFQPTCVKKMIEKSMSDYIS